MTIGSPEAQAVLTRGIVQMLRNAGITVPAELANEVKLINSLQILRDKRQTKKQNTLDSLLSISASDFESGLEKAYEVWTEESPESEFEGKVNTVLNQRIVGALYSAHGRILGDITDKMNQVVTDFQLNEVQLPSSLLGDFNYMRASRAEVEAISAFRDAAPVLDSLWRPYKAVATPLGHDLAGIEYSSALDLVFMLSDVDNFYDAQVLAQGFNTLRMNMDSMKHIQGLGLWGVIHLSGHRIEIRSIAEAQFRRGEIQNAPAPQPVATHRAAGFMLA
ncbi:hypothetical protein SK571_00555 [Lentzea sp. BCCO 10_0798]|uniref:Uncharacterized protein n=1 Tax=Lentzea kristufekii TaxID=3095430 RepID=A0ABU4THV9_9PSEU|nr:hypothetical protein [Lentzea sp. BCCO 10_0798]MDX8047857.1 hypothetical protein [Lentzea sp. BCCO 10_0798]